jgi:N-acetylglutamate synthase-like GNAT family acetyltransferase/2-polyprenyl-3-methyl-5-hydroxy-6-metoxy-1,4-benzoquinol methylase
MNQRQEERLRRQVREKYGAAVSRGGSCCGTKQACCGEVREAVLPRDRVVASAGYAADELKAVPVDAVRNSFGCGNPLALAGVRPGQTVLDIGSGAGLDCFIAADRVGTQGRVIGLDMTPAMIERARANAEMGGYHNVEFRLGEAESMPIEDATADWIVSNCVINLSPNKPRVFAEAFRVLKPGGSLSISDIMVEDLPSRLRRSASLYTSCVAGAIPESVYLEGLRHAGFEDVRVTERIVYDREQILGFLGGSRVSGDMRPLLDKVAGKIWSAKVVARKPAAEAAARSFRFRMASEADEPRIRRLLAAFDLPTADLSEHLQHFILASRDSEPAGCVGLEIHGASALLRSLAVADPFRNAGLGTDLCERLEEYARSHGVSDMYLLTATASGFFQRIGYSAVARDSAPEALRASREFSDLCPSSAMLMVKRL